MPGDQNLRRGVKPNPSTLLGTLSLSKGFEVFDPLDFIAETTQHIPDPGAQQIRY